MGSKWEDKWGVFSKCEKKVSYRVTVTLSPIKPTIRQPEFWHVAPPKHPENSLRAKKRFAEGENPYDLLFFFVTLHRESEELNTHAFKRS